MLAGESGLSPNSVGESIPCVFQVGGILIPEGPSCAPDALRGAGALYSYENAKTRQQAINLKRLADGKSQSQ